MPAHRALVISQPAKADLSDIWAYIAEDNVLAADRVLRRIGAAIERIADFPHASKFDQRFGAHLLSLSPYIVAYTVTDDAIEIIRVVDGRRNLEAVFT